MLLETGGGHLKANCIRQSRPSALFDCSKQSARKYGLRRCCQLALMPPKLRMHWKACSFNLPCLHCHPNPADRIACCRLQDGISQDEDDGEEDEGPDDQEFEQPLPVAPAAGVDAQLQVQLPEPPANNQAGQEQEQEQGGGQQAEQPPFGENGLLNVPQGMLPNVPQGMELAEDGPEMIVQAMLNILNAGPAGAAAAPDLPPAAPPQPPGIEPPALVPPPPPPALVLPAEQQVHPPGPPAAAVPEPPAADLQPGPLAPANGAVAGEVQAPDLDGPAGSGELGQVQETAPAAYPNAALLAYPPPLDIGVLMEPALEQQQVAAGQALHSPGALEFGPLGYPPFAGS